VTGTTLFAFLCSLYDSFVKRLSSFCHFVNLPWREEDHHNTAAAAASGREEEMAAAAGAAFPPPPPFYKLFKDFLDDPSSAPSPPPPVVGTYTMFGGNYTTNDMLPGLEEEGLRQLYPKGPNVDYKKELKVLNRELLLQFLELTDALVERPSQSARQVEAMTLILRNIHHLLNSLRPHQVLLLLFKLHSVSP
jgi:mediator of RNA polymerase II transcription subunit 7